MSVRGSAPDRKGPRPVVSRCQGPQERSGMTMICPFPFLVIACAAAFVPQNDRPRSKVGPLSFKDSSSSGKDLPAIRPPLSEHRPSGTTRGSSSFPARIATEEWKEWQASFGRNGVTDFLRPDHGWSRVLLLVQRPGGGRVVPLFAVDRCPRRVPLSPVFEQKSRTSNWSKKHGRREAVGSRLRRRIMPAAPPPPL